MLPLVIGGALLQAGIGYAQYRKGVKEAKKTDAELRAQQDAYAKTMLPEYKDIESRYKQISESGMEQTEVNQFMRRAQSAQYAQQEAARTMAGGSLARYTLALNNAAMLGQIGQLAAGQFQRKMQGLTGLERQIGIRQERIDTDTSFKRQMLLQKGQAAAGLSQSGLQNIAGALSGAVSAGMSALSGGGGDGGGGNKEIGGDTTSGGGTTGGGGFGLDYSRPSLGKSIFG